MESKIKNFAQAEQLIRKNPREADALASEWLKFAKKYPEAASFETAGELNTWLRQHNIDQSIWGKLEDGRSIQIRYFEELEKHADEQMRTTRRIDPSILPANLAYLPVLALSFLKDHPKIMEDDKDYQKIEDGLKKTWLEKNPGKDFSSKEWVDYKYGSLEDKDTPTLKKDAEKIFRENPKFHKRVERYDKEKDNVYKNPQDDPAVLNLKKTVAEHITARQQLPGSPVDIGEIIQKQASDDFKKNFPEKANEYTENVRVIIAPQEPRHEKEEKKKSTVTDKAQDVYDLLKKGKSVVRAGKTTERFAQRTILGIGRTTGSVVAQAGKGAATGIRGTLLAARAAAPLVSNPIGLIIIGIIIAIILIVFLIILLAGGGGPKPVPTVECVDVNGVVTVTNGSECAQALANYYTSTEGTAVSAVCQDKCTDSARSLSCNRDQSTNECDIILYGSCGGDKVFCIEYSPPNPALNRLYDCATGGPGYVGSPLGVNSCGTAQGSIATFNYTGSPQTWQVPAGVTEIEVELWGAQGDGSFDEDWPNGDYVKVGGKGGYVKTKLSIPSGTSELSIFVGGRAGFNGGGPGGDGQLSFGNCCTNNGIPGAGASDIRIGGTDLVNRVAIAGGGGGAGYATHAFFSPSNGGGGGDTTGETAPLSVTSCSTGGGGTQSTFGGEGGSDTAGGNGGINTTNTISGPVEDPALAGQAGILGIGGKGGNSPTNFGIGGGGGGGGYYGGGGGAAARGCNAASFPFRSAGGGGGSSWVTSDPSIFIGPTTHQQGVRAGDGQVIIHVSQPPIPQPTGNCPARTIPGAFYPASSIICSVSFNRPSHKRLAGGSDNWPTTWSNDGHIYTAWGDGEGFNGNARASLGVARVEGSGSSYQGFNVNGGGSPMQWPGGGTEGKSYGMISIGGTLYMWVTGGAWSNIFDVVTLYRSTNKGRSWDDNGDSVRFTHGGEGLSVPTFLNFGQDNAGAKDNYVYSYFIETQTRSRAPIHKPGLLHLLRVDRNNIMSKSDYEYFSGTAQNPSWSRNRADSKPVFEDPKGVGWNVAASYNAGLGRYILTTEHNQSHEGFFGIFDAPEPWGPWTTVLYDDNGNWENFNGSTDGTFYWNFPTKWISGDGKSFTMVFTGGNPGPLDSWNTINGNFTTAPPVAPTLPPGTTPTPPPGPSGVPGVGQGATEPNPSIVESTMRIKSSGVRGQAYRDITTAVGGGGGLTAVEAPDLNGQHDGWSGPHGDDHWINLPNGGPNNGPHWRAYIHPQDDANCSNPPCRERNEIKSQDGMPADVVVYSQGEIWRQHWWIRIPTNFDNDSDAYVHQHHGGSSGGHPNLRFRVRDNELQVYSQRAGLSNQIPIRRPISSIAGQWIEIEEIARFSNNGFYRFRAWDQNHNPLGGWTFAGNALSSDTVYENRNIDMWNDGNYMRFKWGIYRATMTSGENYADFGPITLQRLRQIP